MDDLRRVTLRLSRALRKAFEAHEEIFLRSLVTRHHAPPAGAWWRQPRQQTGKDLPADLRIAVSRTTAETAVLFLGAIHQAMQQAMRIGGKATISSIDLPLTFTLAHPQAVQYLERCPYEMLEQINLTVYESIVRLRKRSSAHIERDLRGFYRDMALNRSRHIAATIVADAYQAGSAIVIGDLQDAGIRVAQCSGLAFSLDS